jgi:branched-chain amino acid transport system substrate-binding protein
LDEKHDAIKDAVVIEFKNGKQTFKEKVKPE